MSKKKNLRSIQKKWETILKQSNFFDIETREGRLKDFHSIRFQDMYSPEEFQDVERYWQLATQLINTYPFINASEKRIWELYTEGCTIRTIEEDTGVSKTAVHRVIKRIAKAIR